MRVDPKNPVAIEITYGKGVSITWPAVFRDLGNWDVWDSRRVRQGAHRMATTKTFAEAERKAKELLEVEG